MKSASALAFLLVLLAGGTANAQGPITVGTELERMRSAEHLFLPQNYRLYQYSGFHRQGGNPDRMVCLYEEEGWRVVADHKGPGVVSRIWNAMWTDIRIEVDGQVIYEGKNSRFFDLGKLPFCPPLSELRHKAGGPVTAEGEALGAKQWGVSYVPIPFAKRFRYLQRDQVYANINIKGFPPETPIVSFLEANWEQLRPDFEKTAEVWQTMKLYPSSNTFQHIVKRVRSLPSDGSDQVVEVAELQRPAIIREIRVRAENPASYRDVGLTIKFDDQRWPRIDSPLEHGFGSRQQHNLASGQSEQGWGTLSLPMPFRKSAKLALVSLALQPAEFQVEVIVDTSVRLPARFLYLNSHGRQGAYKPGKDSIHPQELPVRDFFYRQGYTALDFVGEGHVIAYMDLYQGQPELDEHVFIDQERDFPDNIWNGTGHEDLFDMAWGHSPLSKPMTSGGSEDFKEVNVKLFWNDPMPFRSAIRWNWEWSPVFEVVQPREARFASVIYWYSR